MSPDIFIPDFLRANRFSKIEWDGAEVTVFSESDEPFNQSSFEYKSDIHRKLKYLNIFYHSEKRNPFIYAVSTMN